MKINEKLFENNEKLFELIMNAIINYITAIIYKQFIINK